ncbi:AraC family transcriptional regulator [Enterococcus sp.]
MDDVNYFSKLFKKYTGQSPRDYRKKHQLFE